MLLSGFPRMTDRNCVAKSPQTSEYNCIGWAAHTTRHFIWPDAGEQFAWPPDLPRRDTVDSFREFFEKLGFRRSPNHELSLEVDYEKLVLYANADGPQHAARQLPSGKWTSKFSELADAEHSDAEVLSDGPYGRIALVMKRVGYAPPQLPALYPPPARLIYPSGAPLIR